VNRSKCFRFAKLVPLAAALVIPVIAHADVIVGNLAVSSSGTQKIGVDERFIDFNFGGAFSGTPPQSTVDPNGSGSGMFDVSGGTDSFSGVGGTITVHDLDVVAQPTGVNISLPNFITFSARPWTVTLTQVLPGTKGSAACDSLTPTSSDDCTPPGSPFNLSNGNGNTVAVSFSFLGTLNSNDGTGSTSDLVGTFSTTFSNTTLQAVLDVIQAHDTVVTTASGTLAATATPTAVPEPGSASSILLGCSLIGLAALGRSARARRMRQ